MIGYLAIGASIFNAIGAIQQGEAQAAAFKFSAAENERAADRAIAAAGFNEARTRTINRLAAGQDRANAANSGFVSSEGSPLEVMAFNAAEAELQALGIRFQGASEAAGFRGQAQMDRMAGKNARRAGYMRAAAALLGGGASFMGGMGGGGNPGAAMNSGSFTARAGSSIPVGMRFNPGGR